MKKVQIVIIVLLFISEAESQVTQQWVSRFNGPANLDDGAGSMVVDGSCNVYVTGSSTGIGTGVDYSTIKYDSSGVFKWEARYNGPGNSTDVANQIKVDGSGNVYVTGNSRSGLSAGTEDYATIKYNSAGVQQWAKRYNGTGNGEDIAYQLSVDVSGNVFVTGSSTGSGTGTDYATIKYNSSGDSLWVRRYNGPGNSTDNSYRITVSDSGNVYVTGYSRSGSAAGSEDIATIKYNSSGLQQWVQRYNNGANDAGYSIAVDGSGNVYLAGFAWNGFSGLDFVVIKYNSGGIQRWLNVITGTGTGYAFCLAVDASGNVYVTGSSMGASNNTDYTTMKFDSTGLSQWSKFYNGPGNGIDEAYSLALDNFGNVYVTGYSAGSGTGNDYATVKYNSSGTEQWVSRYNGPTGDSNDVAYSLALDNSGCLYVTGVSAGSGTGNDFATIKYSQTGLPMILNLTLYIQGFYNATSNNMVNDTVRVYLKNNSSPYNTIDSSKGILNSSGTGNLLFPNAVNGVNYYIQIKHRNSLETWSKTAQTFVSNSLTYNFTTSNTKAYGNNMINVDASPVGYAVYNGDVNKDGTIDLNDVLQTYNAANVFTSGYVVTDNNGDNIVDLNDILIAYNNSAAFVAVIRP